jgi:membrane-bound lytic murein transglycosylase D
MTKLSACWLGLVTLLLAGCATAPIPSTDPAPTPAPVAAAAPAAAPTAQPVQTPPVASVEVKGPTDVWERVRNGFVLTDLDHPLVATQTQFYASKPEYLKRMFDRSSRYMFHIIEEVEKRGMPTEVALLPFIESAFNPQALSHANASGLWQFIPSTGKNYKLNQDWMRDERRDVIAATTAALDYLQKIHDMHKDWYLALASYNWGEGAVGRAVERNRSAGLGTDYVGIMNRMPRETQNYVPKLQAIKNIVANPEKYGITLTKVPNTPYFGTVVKTRDIDVKLAAQLADMRPDEFLALNPSFNRPVILGSAKPLIVLPVDKVEVFRDNLASFTGVLSSYQHYTVNNKERLDLIAGRFAMTEAELKQVNGIPPSHKFATKGTLIVAKADKTVDTQLPANIGSLKAATEDDIVMKRFAYKARKNDSASLAAKRYGVTLADFRSWNNLSGDQLAAGQTIYVMKAVRAGGGQVASGKKAVPKRKPIKLAKR